MEHQQHGRFPDFLGIGAKRAGTTWLYRVLAHHPQLWVPPVKEIHYFDRPSTGRRTLSFDRQFLSRLRSYLRGENARTNGDSFWANLRWDLHYLFEPRGDDWYRRVFRPHPGQLCGEITPAYSGLDDAQVQAIHASNPNLKVILLLRHPIERGWSSVVNHLGRARNTNVSTAEYAELENRVTGRSFRHRSNYGAIIRRWSAAFGAEQLFIGYMDEIESSPHTFIKRLWSFLGVAPMDDALFETLTAPVNSARNYTADIPPEFRRFMAERLLASTEDLDQLLNNSYTAAWLADVRAAANGASAHPPTTPGSAITSITGDMS